MTSVHDLGGKPGYGAPQVSSTSGPTSGIEGSAFAARWEAAVFAMMRCMGARGVMCNSDQFRHAVERVDPANYFRHGYYGRWLGGLETLLVEAGELDRVTLDRKVAELAADLGASADEIDTLTLDANVASRPRPANEVKQFAPSLNAGSSVRYLPQPPLFTVGEWVTTGETAEIARHTRLPAYARNCIGEIVACHGGWVLPDSNAHGDGESPCHLYTVRFSAQALYGPNAEAGVAVHLDLFEPYLSPAAREHRRHTA